MLEQARGPGAIRLLLEDIERDGGRPRLRQALDDPRHLISRPGPLAETAQAIFIDVEDAHRLGQEGTGLDALVEIEDAVAKFDDHLGIVEAQGQGAEQNEKRNDEVDPPAHGGRKSSRWNRLRRTG